MDELALHILDITQNSISAGASHILISVEYSNDLVEITINDNGCGMDSDMAKTITDPFITSRTTRKVGLGIPLLKESCELTGGELNIISQKGTGTKIYASFGRRNIDRPPLGNMGQTVAALISCNPKIYFNFSFKMETGEYAISTKELIQVLGNVPINNPEIAAFIEKDVNSGIQSLSKEEEIL